IEHVVAGKNVLSSMTCLEPACGRGHMSVVLAHYFREVASFDVFDYGFGGIADFLKTKHAPQSFDWVITNPPFRLGEEFINRAMKIARCGVAMLTRTVFIESVGRYENLFKSNSRLKRVLMGGSWLSKGWICRLARMGPRCGWWIRTWFERPSTPAPRLMRAPLNGRGTSGGRSLGGLWTGPRMSS